MKRVRPTPEQNEAFAWSVAKTRIAIIDRLHVLYGAEVRKLKARVRERERRIAKAKRLMLGSGTPDEVLAALSGD